MPPCRPRRGARAAPRRRRSSAFPLARPRWVSRCPLLARLGEAGTALRLALTAPRLAVADLRAARLAARPRDRREAPARVRRAAFGAGGGRGGAPGGVPRAGPPSGALGPR